MKTELTKQIKEPRLRITRQKDDRYFCEYLNHDDLMLNGIGQFGSTAFEAKINLEALLQKLKREQNKRCIIMNVSS